MPHRPHRRTVDELASRRRDRWVAPRPAAGPTKVGVVGPAAWVANVGSVAPAWRRQVVASMDPSALDGSVLTVAGVDELVVNSHAFAAVRAVLPYATRSRMATLVGHDAEHVFAPALSRRARLFKRALDVALGSAALVVAAPVLAVGMAAVKLETRGPALFKQVRPGLDGRSFTMLKLRTMIDRQRRSRAPRRTSPRSSRATGSTPRRDVQADRRPPHHPGRTVAPALQHRRAAAAASTSSAAT